MSKYMLPINIILFGWAMMMLTMGTITSRPTSIIIGLVLLVSSLCGVVINRDSYKGTG